MSKPMLISLSVLCLILAIFHGAIGRTPVSKRNECQLNRLNALEPDSRIQCEAGLIETWNPNHDQFQCAGVAITRHIIDPDGLVLPVYSNAPQLIYIVQGRGQLGVAFPGCAETFQQFQDVRPTSRQLEQSQKIHNLRAGDIIALPAGAANWIYNDGNERVIAVTVYDTSNKDNQLDNNPRNFYLAGNPENEFLQFRREEYESESEKRYIRGGHGRRPLQNCNNVFCGLDSRLVAEAFNIDESLATRLRGENDFRGNIVRVEGQIKLVKPPRTQVEKMEQLERPFDPYRRNVTFNGIEETYCTMTLRENIADTSRADIFIPDVARMSTVNSHNLPILGRIKLSASFVRLCQNAIRLPHWHMNANSILYAIRGQAHIQVVDENGNNVFDGSVRTGEVLTVPQNFAVVKRAETEVFEYVAFKTNDNAISTDIAGRTSALRGLPVEVVANAFRVSIEEARRIKFARQETTFATLRSRSGRRAPV